MFAVVAVAKTFAIVILINALNVEKKVFQFFHKMDRNIDLNDLYVV